MMTTFRLHIWFSLAMAAPHDLKTLFTPKLEEELRQINSGVALPTDDFSSNRAELVRQLNAAGIPTVAVIVLDAADGYYVNADNAATTAARFAEFDKWTTDTKLPLSRVTSYVSRRPPLGLHLAWLDTPVFERGLNVEAHSLPPENWDARRSGNIFGRCRSGITRRDGKRSK